MTLQVRQIEASKEALDIIKNARYEVANYFPIWQKLNRISQRIEETLRTDMIEAFGDQEERDYVN